jgi:hypothetical protein
MGTRTFSQNVHELKVIEKKKLLYVFISIGTNEKRNEIIRSNIEHIVTKNRDSLKYQIDCLLYGYGTFESQPQWVKDMQKDPNAVCTFVKVHKQTYVYFLNSINPLFVSKYDYMTVVVDDVAHYPPYGKFDLETYFDIIIANDLGYISPSLIGSYWSREIGPRAVNESVNQVGRFVKFIEVQATTFRPDVWNCMHQIIDTEFPSGWGIDLWFWQYCIVEKRVTRNAQKVMGLIDTMHVHHNPYNLPSSHTGESPELQKANFRKFKGIELKDTWAGETVGLIYYPK